MLDQPPSDQICDKLNQEHCDETKAVSSLPIIEDSAPSNNTHFFEGVEKNLEVWFTSSNGDSDQSDLRLIPRYQLLFIKGKGHLTLAYCCCLFVFSQKLATFLLSTLNSVRNRQSFFSRLLDILLQQQFSPIRQYPLSRCWHEFSNYPLIA